MGTGSDMSLGALRRAGLILALLLWTAAVAADGEFSGERAMHWIRAQTELGPRVPGTPGHRALQELILAHADSLGLRATVLRHVETSPLTGEEMPLAQIVVSAGPDDGDRLWFGAHYDTRAHADRDPERGARTEPIAGANDGASGTAVLLHLMELLAAAPPAVGVDLLFFDGEDQGRSGELRSYCLGSAWLAPRRQDFGNPLAGGDPIGLVLVDMVADLDPSIPMEGYSLRYAGNWTRAVFQRAAELGLDVFQPWEGRAVYDDHVPFLEAGVPSVDLIDFDYPDWHTRADDLDAVGPRGPGQVGTLLLDLARRPPAP